MPIRRFFRRNKKPSSSTKFTMWSGGTKASFNKWNRKALKDDLSRTNYYIKHPPFKYRFNSQYRKEANRERMDILRELKKYKLKKPRRKR